jgi:GNAT superfamily N-acetyltransferase
MRDFAAIRDLEHASFQSYRQASDRSLRRSLTSKRQSVWVIDGKDAAGHARLDALLVLWHHPDRIRVYDVASHPDKHGGGLGYLLMQHTEALARKQGCHWVSLEADPKEPGLVPWYLKQGYVIVGKPLPHYYHNGNAAVRMVKRVAAGP